MRITAIRDITVPLAGQMANALVNFSEHTVSLVAVEVDVVRNGRRMVGYAFNSIGRYGQSGILRERVIPRLLAAPPETLLDGSGQRFDPAKVQAVAMRNEKPGGHGDRAAAVAAIELACWEINAKLEDEPAWRTIARHAGLSLEPRGVPVYAAGGYYYPQDGLARLQDELRAYRDTGFNTFKIKIGGTSLQEDLRRVEAALTVADTGAQLSVDANGRFDLSQAQAYAKALAPFRLRWLEEMGDPLDFELNRQISHDCDTALATGENLFSATDVGNLLRYAGLRPQQDIFQMDPGLSYGLSEYLQMLTLLEAQGHTRQQVHPHGGHLINLHVVAGLDLGGCEAYPGVFQPFGGFSSRCELRHHRIWPSDAPGFGLEEKDNLRPWLDRLRA